MGRKRSPFSNHTPDCRPDKRSRSTRRSLPECFPSSPSDRMPFISWWPSVAEPKFGAERWRERSWTWARPSAIPKDRRFVPFMLICPAVEGEFGFYYDFNGDALEIIEILPKSKAHGELLNHVWNTPAVKFMAPFLK